MKVLNIHTRKLAVPKSKFIDLFHTLSSRDDKIWPHEKWPPMRLDHGLKLGSKGGHGPIRYEIVEYKPEKELVFEFQKPKGFKGIHKFEISQNSNDSILLTHTIDVDTNLLASLQWILGIRVLHNALIEDAFDKVENTLTGAGKKTEWSLWVKTLRFFLK